jgi:hypothetical protein
MPSKANEFSSLGPPAQGSAIDPADSIGSGANVIYPTAFAGHGYADIMTPSLSEGSAEATGDLGTAYRGDIMSDPTREEFDAKLATIEARAETRFVEVSGKIDRVADAIGALTSAVTAVRTEVKEDGKFTRWTVGVTLIASLIAFGAALWVTQGNILSAFQAGLLLKSEQVAPSPSAPRPSTH